MASVVEAVFKAFELDPDGASVLVDEAVWDWACEYADAHEGELQALVAAQVAATTALAKRALARSYVETMVGGSYPDDEVHKTAGWLAGIDAYTAAVLEGVAKDRDTERWFVRGRYENRMVNRTQGGQFARYVDTGQRSTIEGLPFTSVAPNLRGTSVAAEPSGAARLHSDVASDADRRARVERHQHQWEQANAYMAELAQAYHGPEKDVKVQLTLLKGDGKQAQRDYALRDAKRGLAGIRDFNPLDDQILSVHLYAGPEAEDEAVRAVQRFNTVGGLGGGTLAALATGTNRAQWERALSRYEPQEQTSRLTQIFGNLAGAGQVLAAVPGAEKASAFAQLVGSVGPQAEEVLGPHVKRAAYRYRGTEKQPDKVLRDELVGDEQQALRHAAEGATAPEDVPYVRGFQEKVELKPGQFHTPTAGAARLRLSQGARGDQLKMQVAADVAAHHLIGTLPRDPITAELSLRSGHVLPSQGVLLDADGRLVSQAVGYADDHYLPFDLKNMGRLRGGQYVRTRVQGGLTGEDVYAAVQTGARQVTVVSSSGVYSLELDPAFRGARGNSDKARAMYGRYLQILDAVSASDLYLKDIPGSKKDQVRADYELMHPDEKKSSDAYKDGLKAKMNEARRDAMQLADPDALERQALAQAKEEAGAKGMSPDRLARRQEDIYEELKAAELAEKVAPLALNAKGYAVALQTLKSQFPYFIRDVSYEPLTETREGPGFVDRRAVDDRAARGRSIVGRADRGYVRPGSLRPHEVQRGFYERGTLEPEFKQPLRERAGELATPGTTAVEGEPGAGVPAPSAATAAVGAPGAPLPIERVLGPMSTRADAVLTSETSRLSTLLGGLTNQKLGHGLAEQGWDDVKDLDVDLRAQVLLDKPNEMVRLVKTDPRAVEAMTNKAAVANAFTTVYGRLLTDSMASWSAEKRAQYDGAQNEEELAAWVADHAQRIGDAANLVDPFVPEASAPAFHTGSKPQLFRDLGGLDTAERFTVYTASGPGKATKDLADQLFPAREGRYRSASAAAGRANRDIKDLERIKNAAEANRGADTARLAYLTGMEAEDVERVLGGPAQTGNALAAQIDARALAIQKAWSLHQVQRSLEFVAGGEVHPKEASRVLKSVRPGSSSRQAVLLEPAHPLVHSVLMAQASGRL